MKTAGNPQYFTAAAHKAHVLIRHWVFLYLFKFILQLFYLIELTKHHYMYKILRYNM